MSEQLKTTSPIFPYDMSQWCKEKCTYTIESLVSLIDDLNELEEENDLYKVIQGNVYKALYDATKLWSFFCVAEWSVDDPELILTRGVDGYEAIAVKYKVMEQSQLQKFQEFLQLLGEYLDGEKVPNRTLIHELFQQYSANRHLLKQETFFDEMKGYLEEVTQGSRDWSDFVSKAKIMIENKVWK